MMKRVRWSLIALLAIASLTGPEACKGGAQCLRHTDCTREESCDLGTCVMKSTPDSGLSDAGDNGTSTGGRVSATGGKSASGGSPASGGDTANGGTAGTQAGAAGDAGAGG
jgi:hypothetical protein